MVGGSDGEPKLYRIFRQTARVIGDDSNLIREFPPMPGRVYSVAVSADGKRIAAGSSLDGAGEVDVYSYEFDTGLPDNIKAIMAKVVTRPLGRGERRRSRSTTRTASSRSPRSRCRRAASTPSRSGPTASSLAAAGADGIVRLIDPETGAIVKEFAPVAARRAASAAGGRRRPPSRPSSEEAGRDRDAARGGRRSRRSRSSPGAIQLDEPVRLRPARSSPASSPRARRST